MKSLSDLDPQGKNFLVRCDLDVLNEKAEVLEIYRLKSCLKTLNYIQEKGGNVTIAGHYKTSIAPTSNKDLSFDKLYFFFSNHLANNNFNLLPNLRDDDREIENNSQMAWELSLNQDYFVNESFATSHREHTSICEITKFLPSFLGFHFQEELNHINQILRNPNKPLTVIIGGSKLESKLPTIEKMLDLADWILVGGLIASDPNLPQSPKIIKMSDTADSFDIGPNTISEFRKLISQSKTIFWAGPLGVVEKLTYETGSFAIARAIIDSQAFSLVGGGDTIAFLEKKNLLDQFSFVSVGGSALLEYLSTGKLIGLEYLETYGQKIS